MKTTDEVFGENVLLGSGKRFSNKNESGFTRGKMTAMYVLPRENRLNSAYFWRYVSSHGLEINVINRHAQIESQGNPSRTEWSPCAPPCSLFLANVHFYVAGTESWREKHNSRDNRHPWFDLQPSCIHWMMRDRQGRGLLHSIGSSLPRFEC